MKDNLMNFNMDDFKGKILGAMENTNKAIQEAQLTRSQEKQMPSPFKGKHNYYSLGGNAVRSSAQVLNF